MAAPIQSVPQNMVGSTGTLATSATTSWAQQPAPEHLLVSAVITDLGVNPSFTMPGWNQIGSSTVTAAYAMAWWWRTTGVGEPSSATVSWTGLAGQYAHVCAEYAGTAVVLPILSVCTAGVAGATSNTTSVDAAATNPSPALFLAVVGIVAPTSRTNYTGGFKEVNYQASVTVSLSLAELVANRADAVCGCTLGSAIAWCSAVTAFGQTPEQSLAAGRLSNM